MRQPCGEPRLAHEPLAEVVAAGEMLGQELQRHGAAELAVACEVDDGHATVAKRVVDPVPPPGDRLDAQSPSPWCFPCPLSLPLPPCFASVGRGVHLIRAARSFAAAE